MKTLKIGFIGDSITYNGLSTSSAINIIKNEYGYSIVSVIKGHSGSKTSDWVDGSIYLNDAKNAFTAAGVTHVSICLGANDAIYLRSKEAVKTDLTNICNSLILSGFKVIMNQPAPAILPFDGYTQAMMNAAISYDAIVGELKNGITIFEGDISSRVFFENHREMLLDGIHDTEESALYRGKFWAEAILKENMKWVKYSSNHIITASQAWEIDNVMEATIKWFNNQWYMWYTGGWGNNGIGVATSEDGITWTKYTNNPVITDGAGMGCHDDVYIENGTLYCYYSYHDSVNSKMQIRLTKSTNGIDWSYFGIVAETAVSDRFHIGGNNFMFYENGIYYLFHEYGTNWEYNPNFGGWHIGLFSSTSPEGPFLNALSGLSIPVYKTLYEPYTINSGGCGGMFIKRIGSEYHAWYHGSPASSTPSYIYHAKTRNILTDTWEIIGGVDPVLTITGEGYEVDQIADPYIIDRGNEVWMYYEGGNNETGEFGISIAKFNGTMCELLNIPKKNISKTSLGFSEIATGRMIQQVHPVLYSSDLYHPWGDDDDIFDIASIYGIDNISLRGVILDRSWSEGVNGHVYIDQLNHLTGKNVPYSTGLTSVLSSISDTGSSQTGALGAVNLILKTLNECSERVDIVTVGSLRDVAAAYNTNPALFRTKSGRIFVFGGEARLSTFGEYNVGADVKAWLAIMRSDLDIYWCPCFDGGVDPVSYARYNNGYATYWAVNNLDANGNIPLLDGLDNRLKQFFIYNELNKDVSTVNPITFLSQAPTTQDLTDVVHFQQELFCSAVFQYINNTYSDTAFTFEEVNVKFDDTTGKTVGYNLEGGHAMKRFKRVMSQSDYSTHMTTRTNEILKNIPLI